MEFVLNGQSVQVADPQPQATLLDWLRDRGLTGSKEGCAEGECGACTVLVVGPRGDGSEFTAINSCLAFLPMMAGHEAITVEGLSRDGVWSEPQRAIAEMGGSQCGYCTPGFAVSLFAEYYRPDRTGACDPHAMGGNLCRCTGYRPIRDAALLLGPAPDDVFAARLKMAAPRIGGFTSNGFVRPVSLPGCLDMLAVHPEAHAVAGATDLAVEANLLYRRWPLLVSLEALAELRVFHDAADHVEVGAGLTLAEIERAWTGAPLAVTEWFPLFASPLIRNRATLGGNLATASPIGDAAPLLLALGAQVKIAGLGGERVVPLDEFFTGYRKTALRAGELIVSVIVPKPYPQAARFYKIAKRRLDDISTVAACIAIDRDPAGVVTRARFAYGGVAATPVRVHAAESAAVGREWTEVTIREVQAAIVENLKPLSDHRGSAEYRLAMAQAILEKFA